MVLGGAFLQNAFAAAEAITGGKMNALVRLEQPSDAAVIHHVLRSAFPTDQEARLVDRLRQHQQLRLFLIAESMV